MLRFVSFIFIGAFAEETNVKDATPEVIEIPGDATVYNATAILDESQPIMMNRSVLNETSSLPENQVSGIDPKLVSLLATPSDWKSVDWTYTDGWIFNTMSRMVNSIWNLPLSYGDCKGESNREALPPAGFCEITPLYPTSNYCRKCFDYVHERRRYRAGVRWITGLKLAKLKSTAFKVYGMPSRIGPNHRGVQLALNADFVGQPVAHVFWGKCGMIKCDTPREMVVPLTNPGNKVTVILSILCFHGAAAIQFTDMYFSSPFGYVNKSTGKYIDLTEKVKFHLIRQYRSAFEKDINSFVTWLNGVYRSEFQAFCYGNPTKDTISVFSVI